MGGCFEVFLYLVFDNGSCFFYFGELFNNLFYWVECDVDGFVWVFMCGFDGYVGDYVL